MLVAGLSTATTCHRRRDTMYYCGATSDVLRCTTCTTRRCGPKLGCQCSACRTVTERPFADRELVFVAACDTLAAVVGLRPELGAHFLKGDGIGVVLAQMGARARSGHSGEELDAAARRVIASVSQGCPDRVRSCLRKEILAMLADIFAKPVTLPATTGATGLVRREGLEVGARVVRSEFWHYGDQDGGPGNEGVITGADHDNWIRVRWDRGGENVYEVPEGGATIRYVRADVVLDRKDGFLRLMAILRECFPPAAGEEVSENGMDGNSAAARGAFEEMLGDALRTNLALKLELLSTESSDSLAKQIDFYDMVIALTVRPCTAEETGRRVRRVPNPTLLLALGEVCAAVVQGSNNLRKVIDHGVGVAVSASKANALTPEVMAFVQHPLFAFHLRPDNSFKVSSRPRSRVRLRAWSSHISTHIPAAVRTPVARSSRAAPHVQHCHLLCDARRAGRCDARPASGAGPACRHRQDHHRL